MVVKFKTKKPTQKNRLFLVYVIVGLLFVEMTSCVSPF